MSERDKRSLESYEGQLMSAHASTDALSNQHWEFAQFVVYQRRANFHIAQEFASLRKTVERAVLMPLAIVAFFFMKEVSAPAAWQLGVTLFFATLALFFPEVLARLARKTPLGEAVLPPKSTPPPPRHLAPVPGTKPERDTQTNE